jgi:hypothetical protein
MHRHRTGRVAVLAATLFAVLAGADTERGQGREFNGTVLSIDGGAMVVEDRRGERVTFNRGEDVAVEGKSGWGAIARGDRVIVKWSLSDGPRRAQRVIVLGGGQAR